MSGKGIRLPCHGIDLTEEYCRAAAMLSAKVGLADLVDYRQGDATNLPFYDASFDVVWTEHLAMNIPVKHQLYKDMHRILRLRRAPSYRPLGTARWRL